MSSAPDPGQSLTEATQTGPAALPTQLPDQLADLTLRVATLEAQLATLLTVSTAAPPPPLTQGHLSRREGQSHPPPPQNGDHLDRSEEQSHRSSRSAETPEFRLPPTPSSPAPSSPAPPHRRSLEDRLGAQIFNIIGAAAIIIGASWALKLAIDHGLIGPVARILIGLAAGTALILWSERFRRRSLPAFSYSLKAVGSGVLYLSLWASFQLYHLLPANVAFAAMLLVTAWNAWMAWSQDAELLAAYALAGGLATPLLLSTGGDHETFLFLYLATLDAATVLLLRVKPWPRLLPPAFLATALYFIAWYSRYFHAAVYVGSSQATISSSAWDTQSTETTLFILLFFILFALPSLRAWLRSPLHNNSVPHSSTASPSMNGSTQQPTSIFSDALLPLANAAFLSLALYSVLQDSGLHAALAWLMLALSALYLGLMRLQATGLARAIHLALAVVFLTVAIPLKASGQTLTTAWLVEGLVLYWASTRIQTQHPADSQAPIRVLQLLSAAGYLLGLLSLAIHWSWRNDYGDTFLNANLGSALVALASLAALTWLASREAQPRSFATLTLSITAIDLLALLLLTGELASFQNAHTHTAFRSADFFNAVIALAVLAAASWSEYRLARANPAESHPLWILAASSLVAFNLFAILTGVREINALWSTPGIIAPEAYAAASVQRSLAISAFLMLYGATLLAAGFWRRSAFVRWQALLLLIFTILKVFLWDVSGLSQGYRVASFLGLGALLMAVSFAYQKDWLNLKADPQTSTPPYTHEDPA